ncbi:class I SAM-dependent methyltransferase [Streptomyces sp. NPDC020845]|uniref:class I SAM-dependent methyltransferase n=1 Tax=Streptomyces sp. NPDC020845 TaxID=3365096 RepID=UPI0037B534E1
MADEQTEAPESSAVRVALWRAMHLEADSPPHVLEDEIGLQLATPEEDWRRRPDMDQRATSGFRAAIVARARFIEELVAEQADRGVAQYVILGAGLDTFAQRKPEIASRLRVFEVDQPGPQAWKRRRLAELGYGIPDWLHLVPVDFEASESWLEQLTAAGFDPGRPAVIVSTGVTMYLTKEATAATCQSVSRRCSRSAEMSWSTSARAREVAAGWASAWADAASAGEPPPAGVDQGAGGVQHRSVMRLMAWLRSAWT